MKRFTRAVAQMIGLRSLHTKLLFSFDRKDFCFVLFVIKQMVHGSTDKITFLVSRSEYVLKMME